MSMIINDPASPAREIVWFSSYRSNQFYGHAGTVDIPLDKMLPVKDFVLDFSNSSFKLALGTYKISTKCSFTNSVIIYLTKNDASISSRYFNENVIAPTGFSADDIFEVTSENDTYKIQVFLGSSSWDVMLGLTELEKIS